MNSTIFELLERIKEKPGMYLGYPSVQSLFMFLNGYDLAREEFQPWLQKKLGVRTVTSWAKLIMLSCHDEKTGFERFFELLSEFRQKKDLSTSVDEHCLPVVVMQ